MKREGEKKVTIFILSPVGNPAVDKILLSWQLYHLSACTSGLWVDREFIAGVLLRRKFVTGVTLLGWQFRAIGHMLSGKFILGRPLIHGHMLSGKFILGRPLVHGHMLSWEFILRRPLVHGYSRLLVHWEFIEVFICAVMLMFKMILENIRRGCHTDLVIR